MTDDQDEKLDPTTARLLESGLTPHITTRTDGTSDMRWRRPETGGPASMYWATAVMVVTGLIVVLILLRGWPG